VTRDLTPLFLSDAEIAGLRIDPREMVRAVEAAFRSLSEGRAVAGGKLPVRLSDGCYFTAKAGALPDEGYAAVKWYGVVADNDGRGLPGFVPIVILNSVETGLPLAVMDGQWLTAARTAAIAAAAARILAKPDSAAVGFVACGRQADANLDALLPHFPLRRVVAYSRTRASAERLAARAESLGLSAEVARRPQDAVAGMDIVVTSVPRLPGPTRFLDAGWLSAGAFVAMVDMGFSWNELTVPREAAVFTDAFEPGTRTSREMLNLPGPFAADLAEMIADPAGWRADGSSRRAFVFAGAGIADVAAAAVVYRHALARRGLATPEAG